MRIKTPKEYERDLKKCNYCFGSGTDIFNFGLSCPNCSKDVLIIYKNKTMTKQEFEELTGENPEDVLDGDWQNEVDELTSDEKEEIINNKIKDEIYDNYNA